MTHQERINCWKQRSCRTAVLGFGGSSAAGEQERCRCRRCPRCRVPRFLCQPAVPRGWGHAGGTRWETVLGRKTGYANPSTAHPISTH